MLHRRDGTEADRTVATLLDSASEAFEMEGALAPSGKWLFHVPLDVPGTAMRPLVLTSLAGAEAESSQRSIRYGAIRRGIADLAFSGVFVPADLEFPGWRTRPRMSTALGARFDRLDSRAETWGASGDFSYGLWAFLGDRRAAMALFDQSARYPLSDAVLRTYLDPPRGYSGPSAPPPREFFSSGFAEIATRCGARVAAAESRTTR